MKKWQIKTKKDWCIAFLFAFLIICVLAEYKFSWTNDFLQKFFPDKMNYTCQPKGYAVFLLIVAGMTIFTGIVLVLKKKSVKLLAGLIGVSILLCIGTVSVFQYHCRLIVRMPEKSEPQSADLHDWNTDFSPELSKEETKKLSELMYALKQLPKEAQEKLNQKEWNGGIHIWLTYPEKYGQSYWMIAEVEDGAIRMSKNGGMPYVFYEDNGVLDYLEQFYESVDGI